MLKQSVRAHPHVFFEASPAAPPPRGLPTSSPHYLAVTHHGSCGILCALLPRWVDRESRPPGSGTRAHTRRSEDDAALGGAPHGIAPRTPRAFALWGRTAFSTEPVVVGPSDSTTNSMCVPRYSDSISVSGKRARGRATQPNALYVYLYMGAMAICIAPGGFLRRNCRALG